MPGETRRRTRAARNAAVLNFMVALRAERCPARDSIDEVFGKKLVDVVECQTDSAVVRGVLAELGQSDLGTVGSYALGDIVHADEEARLGDGHAAAEDDRLRVDD